MVRVRAITEPLATAIAKRLVEHRWLDWLFASALTFGHALLAWRTNQFDILRTTGFANRLSLYTDMITVTGILLGFAATALASYLAFSGPQIVSFRKHAGQKVLAQWMSVLGGLAITLGVLIICKITDRDGTSAAGMRWVAEAALIFAGLRIGRLLWLFKRLVQVATTPPSGRSRRETPIAVRVPGKRDAAGESGEPPRLASTTPPATPATTPRSRRRRSPQR